jgi:hypothetical protein
MGVRYVLPFLLGKKNHKILNNSTTTEAIERMVQELYYFFMFLCLLL